MSRRDHQQQTVSNCLGKVSKIVSDQDFFQNKKFFIPSNFPSLSFVVKEKRRRVKYILQHVNVSGSGICIKTGYLR